MSNIYDDERAALAASLGQPTAPPMTYAQGPTEPPMTYAEPLPEPPMTLAEPLPEPPMTYAEPPMTMDEEQPWQLPEHLKRGVPQLAPGGEGIQSLLERSMSGEPPTPADAPVARRARGPVGPRMPTIPGELQAQHGGYYYPEDYAQQVEESDMPAAQKKALLLKHAAWQKTQPGLAAEILRTQKEGAQERMQLQQGMLGEEAGAFERSGFARGVAGLHEQRKQEQFDAYREAYKGEQETRAAQISAMNAELASTKIDPGRAWKNKHPAQTIMSIIGIALGGFAHGFSGGKIKNSALEMMQKEIDRDIDAQKADVKNKRAAVGEQRTLYAMARERFGDDQAAHEYTKANLWRQAERFARTQARQLQGKQLQADAELIAQQFGENAEVNELKFRSHMEGLKQAAAMRRMGGVAKPKGAPGAQWKKADSKREGLYVPWLGGFAADKDTAKKLRELRTSSTALDRQLAELQRLSKTGSTLSIGDRARSDSITRQARISFNKVADIGVMDKGTEPYLEGIIPDPLHISTLGEDERLKAARDGIKAKVAAHIEAANLTPGVLETRLDEKGNVVRQYALAPPGARPKVRTVDETSGTMSGTGVLTAKPTIAEAAMKAARLRAEQLKGR